MGNPEAAAATDAELAERLASGDREAEGELYRRLAPRVRLFGLRHLRDPAAADDLAQDVLMTAFESLRAGKVRDTAQIASFVLGTCRMAVSGRRRQSRRRADLLKLYGDALRPAPADSPLDPGRLTPCLQALAERERTVVVLSFYAERGSREIAQELGMTETNVRVSRHRALARLRDCMERTA
jgi:RNA polymerase sigma-70 factor (ECF subfamily)